MHMTMRALVSALLWLSVPVAAQIPRQSPEYAIQMGGGKQVLLSQYRGKPVALMFILTSCGHCQMVTQALTKIQAEFAPRGFQVLSAAIEDGAERNVAGFVNQFKPNFPVGYTPRNSVLEYLQMSLMKPMMMPQLVFIDPKGVIKAQYGGDDDLFKEPAEKKLRAAIEALVGAKKK